MPEYISLFTKTDVAKKYFFTNATQSTNLSSISMTTLGNTPIALPPIDEQYSVLQRVGEQTVAADALETNYVKAIDEVEELPRIILVKAFTGELTEQNPDDEPGSMLLDQIQAEREVIKNKPKIAKKVRRPKEDKVIMNIVETLKANGGKMKSSDLWLSSSFKENIELFYVALRTEVEVNGKVKETLDRQYVELTEI